MNGALFSRRQKRSGKMADKCACKGDYLDKFIQPAILAMIHEKPAYGFYLLAEMESRELVDKVDATGFYRTLRKLEEDGKLSSEWQIEEGEKPKKVYTITDDGRACLNNWQKTLHDYIGLLGRISDTVDQSLSRWAE